MQKTQLQTLSKELAIKILLMLKTLKQIKENVISYQIARSGTSIGANIREAQFAQSKADFITKLRIALKEAGETSYWLELLWEVDYIDDVMFKELSTLCTKIKILLVHSLKTASKNL